MAASINAERGWRVVIDARRKAFQKKTCPCGVGFVSAAPKTYCSKSCQSRFCAIGKRVERITDDLSGIATLRKLVSYDCDTGIIKWLPRQELSRLDKMWNTQRAAKPINSISSEGYIRLTVGQRSLYAHRVAFALYHEKWPSGVIDHINGNRTDNRIANLRDVTRCDNVRNCRLSATNKSGFTGVRFIEKRNKWRSEIRVFDKRYFLGEFLAFDDAVSARKLANKKFGFDANHGAQRHG